MIGLMCNDMRYRVPGKKYGKIKEKQAGNMCMTDQAEEEKGIHRTLGSGMIILAWILVLGLLTFYFSQFLKRQHNPNTSIVSQSTAGVNEVRLQQNRQGHYVASGRINGEAVEFLLDTGATMVAIPGHIAEKLGLEWGPGMTVITANGVVPVYATRLEEVTLGNITLNNVRAAISPSMYQDSILLGMTFLRQLEFTQRNDQLVLRQYHQP